MKQFVVGFIALFFIFNAHSASTNYGIASVGFSDFEFTNVENSGLAYSVAFGREIHRQWYDIASTRDCGNSELSGDACSFDEGVVAGIAGLGFDYYVGLKSMVRLEYTYLGGEDDLSTHLVSLGFRYNF
mgnify:CR=1 FL=1